MHRESELTPDDGSELTAAEQLDTLRTAVAAALEISHAGNGKALGVRSVRAVQAVLSEALAPTRS